MYSISLNKRPTGESHGTQNIIHIIKAVRQHLGLGLKEAKDFVDAAPAPMQVPEWAASQTKLENLAKEIRSFGLVLTITGHEPGQAPKLQLFLVRGDVTFAPFMGDHEVRTEHRLVEAVSKDEALEKFDAHFMAKARGALEITVHYSEALEIIR